MFDWVLNTPLNVITNYFLDVSTFYVNDLLNLFSTVNFSYQYLNKAIAYLESSWTSTMQLIRETFFAKCMGKHLCWSLFLKVLQTGLYPLKQSLGVFCEKDFLKLYSKFTAEHPLQSMISLKLLCNFIEITPCHGCSLVNLLDIFRTPFCKNTSGELLLYPATSLKEKTPTQVFLDEFWHLFTDTFFTEHLQETASVLRKIFYQ